MRHNAKRSSRGNRPQKKNNKMKVFDSNGPDARIRGTAYQVTEKYETLAKDAETSGNFVLAENYRQHAEHYQRIINTFEEEDARQAQAKAKKEAESEKNGNRADDSDDLDLPATMVAEAPVEQELAMA